jgi:hypothetical protein
VGVEGALHQRLHVGFPRHVGGHRSAADLVRDPLRPVGVEVGDDDRLGPLGREAPAEGRADPARPTGDDDDLVAELH